jgi:hypothetical protein
LYLISPRPRALVAAACGAAATLAVGAAAAFAQATISTNRGCYVVGQTARLSGSGFAPSTSYTVSVDGVLFDQHLRHTDSQGSLSVKLLPGGLPAGAAQHTDKVTVDDGTGNKASTSFTLTRSALALLTGLQKTSRGESGRFKAWGFSPDGSARELYLHYVGPSGRVHRTVALGQTKGACGWLVSKRELFLPFSLSRGTWTLQVDTRRSYARHPDGPVSRIRVSLS